MGRRARSLPRPTRSRAAAVEPPQLARLAAALGLPGVPLRVEQFVDLFSRRRRPVILCEHRKRCHATHRWPVFGRGRTDAPRTSPCGRTLRPDRRPGAARRVVSDQRHRPEEADLRRAWPRRRVQHGDHGAALGLAGGSAWARSGEDRFGAAVLHGLAIERIDATGVVVSPEVRTPVAGVLVDPRAEPAYLGYPGTLRLAELPEAWLPPAADRCGRSMPMGGPSTRAWQRSSWRPSGLPGAPARRSSSTPAPATRRWTTPGTWRLPRWRPWCW